MQQLKYKIFFIKLILGSAEKSRNLEETSNYCTSRIKIAGGLDDVFTSAALLAIHTISGGFPRTINNIAVASLMYATVRKIPAVDEEAVYQANY